MRFKVDVEIMPKAGIADPQGVTIERALPTLGFDGITEVTVGKRIEFVLDALDEDAAKAIVKSASEKFLIQPVLENFTFHLSVIEGAVS